VVRWLVGVSDGACLSNVTVGTPNVAPSNAASAPPRLCPVSQIVEVGYVAVRFRYNPCNHKVSS
jgi:hypothetical protein